MILRTHFDDKLAQAGYLVGCSATGGAIVIDPLRDIRPYLALAEANGLRIVAIAETHIHADYLSGTRELSAATGATMYLSDEGDDLWKYAFGDDPKAVLIKDGHRIEIGNLTLTAVHTPGHTPEHISYLLVDHPAGETPHSFFTGDFIFVGDVGRPDLLERAANFEGTMEHGARILFQSLQKTKSLPDSLLIWPAHGAGSACGKALGGSPVSSLGYERKTNWAFQIESEDRFVEEVLAGQPEPPLYFKMMKMLNKQGPNVLGSLPHPRKLPEAIGNLVDVRTGDSIRAGTVERALTIPAGKGVTNWAGWLLAYDEPVTLIADSAEQAADVARDLATIGLDVVAGWMPLSEVSGAAKAIPQVEIDEILPTDLVLDIRGINEWHARHLEQAMHIPLGYLPIRINEVPTDRRVVVHCASGMRSPIAVSVLRRNGFTNVVELRGGLNAVSLARTTA
jgi:hydroxyacylglutathione hydrolase